MPPFYLLLGDGDNFLNVTTDSTNITEHKGYEAQWVINVSSYPTEIEYTWTKEKEDQRLGIKGIKEDKYRVERKANFIILKILNLSLRDLGRYSFQVELKNNKNYSKKLDLHLTVLGIFLLNFIKQNKPWHVLYMYVILIVDVPDVHIKSKDQEFWEYGKNYTMECAARGFPIPRVSWVFLEMQKYDDIKLGSGSNKECKTGGSKEGIKVS